MKPIDSDNSPTEAPAKTLWQRFGPPRVYAWWYPSNAEGSEEEALEEKPDRYYADDTSQDGRRAAAVRFTRAPVEELSEKSATNSKNSNKQDKKLLSRSNSR
jgi:hypothetical protein